jgi:hypothetical protein
MGGGMSWQAVAIWMSSLLVLATLPASTNYQLNSYGFGNGGTANSASTNYRVNGLAGEQAGAGSSTNYKVGAGENYLKQANVPKLTLSNPSNWYDKLQLVLDPQSNPTDATFLIEISTDSFTTVDYVQDDFTVGTSLVSTDYMTYSELGGSSGVTLRGLTPSSIYSVQAAALRGSFTESQFGPVSTASTVSPQLSFAIGVSPTYAITSPPYQVAIGSLLAGSVVTAPSEIWFTISTNADNGAMIYGDGVSGGLSSASTGHVISSSSADLSSLSEGFGEQDGSVTQTSGGPLFTVSPYNVTGTNVGQDYTSFAELFGTNAPITTGEAGLNLMAKASTATPSASDYAETLTAVAAGSF